MKGPDASMVAAIRVLRAHGLPGRGRVLVTLHGMHESGGNEPLHALIARGIHGDAVITGELGGGVDLPIGGLGLSFWEIVVERSGPAMHETVADARDASIRSRSGGSCTRALADLRDRLADASTADPKPSLFIGKFVSGDYPNRLPVRAELAGTRRHDETIGPGGGRGGAGGPGRRRPAGDRRRRSSCVSCRSPSRFSVDPAEPIVRAMRDAHRDLYGNDLRLTRGRVATNAVHFVRRPGIPAVGYGPDPITNHSDHEELAVSELSRIAGGFALASALYLERAAR